ncbi:MAG TPA: DUF3137 domain-containing protein [Caulobacteraceae bacterium]|nr:DUF3137 domain-containing protein [Caulobacteraceae bacterium]
MTDAGTAMDPLTGEAFDRLWTGEIEPQLRRLEGERQVAMRRAQLIWLGFVVLVGVECLVTWMITGGRTFWPEGHLLAVTVVGGAVIGYMPLQLVAGETKRRLITTLCTPMGVTYSSSPGEPAGFKQLLTLKLLPHPEDKSFEDGFAGRRGPSDFSFCEATLTQGSGKERHTVFRGQLFRIAFPRRFLGTTVVLRDSGWLNRFECPKGLEKVGLEDPHFEQIFEVFGDDQVEARAILTPVFMEQLVALETAYAGHHLRCGFCEGELLIAIEGQDRFEIGDLFSTLDSRARAESMASDIRAVLHLIDAFVGAPH